MLKVYNLYTDGSCPSNGSKDAIGGWAFIALHDNMVDPISVTNGFENNTTNQRMELLAAIKACDFMEDYIARTRNGEDYVINLYSDSAYLINCYKQAWWMNWQNNGWLNAKKEPVANPDLWVRLIPYFQDIRFKFNKVAGHSGDVYNEQMDKLCRQAVVQAKQEA